MGYRKTWSRLEQTIRCDMRTAFVMALSFFLTPTALFGSNEAHLLSATLIGSQSLFVARNSTQLLSKADLHHRHFIAHADR
ncbi:hypothetical protein [Salisaeta icosahedral phage 1]|uniref:hypothetical protein n=1 Tax=Salisaeta icosahedral phage 1 TaxID=1183239 RepID=UPI00025EA92D|nr:hypothetical protein A322_gp32 [Salisaeta icosahedral phage 1]AFJ21487.1 hypothetical protein [Salisaeta icosahedral phage 1]